MRSLAPPRPLLSLAALALAAALGPACSTQQCADMQSSGSVFTGFFCGGEGQDAPPIPDGGSQPNACSDIKLVMPEFFALLEANQLTGIQEAVEQIGQPVCADNPQPHCTADTVCPIGVCDTTSNLCPCQNVYSPLGNLLELTFQGLAAISNPDLPGEPGAVAPSKCVDATAAAQLTAAQRNPLCEIKRTLDFLLNQNGGEQLFNDPNITAVLVDLLNYMQGNPSATPPVPTHYELFTTFGLMAQNPGVCNPSTTYDVLDKALIYMTPAVGNKVIGDINALLDDPTTVALLNSLGGGTSDPAARRQAVVTILLSLLPSIEAAQSGAEALSPIENILVNVLKLYSPISTYTQQFQGEVRAVLSDLGCADPENTGACSIPDDPITGSGLLGPDAGIFPDITNPSTQSGLIWCISYVDPTGNLMGALYDLMTLQSTAAGGQIDLPTLLGALQELLQLDPTGQVNRSLRYIIESLGANPDATEAVRELLAQALTPQVGAELIPPLSQLIQHQVVGEILSLLQDLLYGCSPPANSSAP